MFYCKVFFYCKVNPIVNLQVYTNSSLKNQLFHRYFWNIYFRVKVLENLFYGKSLSDCFRYFMYLFFIFYFFLFFIFFWISQIEVKNFRFLKILQDLKFNDKQTLKVCITWKVVGFLGLYIFPGYKTACF